MNAQQAREITEAAKADTSIEINRIKTLIRIAAEKGLSVVTTVITADYISDVRRALDEEGFGVDRVIYTSNEYNINW